MGERDKLIEGAKRCLQERGYAHSTARDIARASGANLASIGYHFGSKDALLLEAMLEATMEWAEKLQHALTDDARVAEPPQDRFESLWRRVIEMLDLYRPVFVANIEVFAQAERQPRLRRELADAQESARLEWAGWLGPQAHPVPEETRRAVGSFYLTMLTGLVMQRLIDPERAPTSEELSRALRAIAVCDDEPVPPARG
ncbi:TetR/AcrR family transcriptional regulator [Streptosporangium sp. CA-135522]|uniref:TetR/AcrR family transcriptional regulator n=1 Tax=Streptosporangium sp. CA-135522 TaxID=3240072 RepID=UPI003D931FBA